MLVIALLLCTSCTALILTAVAGISSAATVAVGASPIIAATVVGVAVFGTDMYLDSLDSFTHVQPPESGFSRVLYEIRQLGQTLIYGVIVLTLAFVLVFRGSRKKAGNMLRTIFGNSSPKKWTVENYERLNNLEKALLEKDTQPE